MRWKKKKLGETYNQLEFLLFYGQTFLKNEFLTYFERVQTYSGLNHPWNKTLQKISSNLAYVHPASCMLNFPCAPPTRLGSSCKAGALCCAHCFACMFSIFFHPSHVRPWSPTQSRLSFLHFYSDFEAPNHLF